MRASPPVPGRSIKGKVPPHAGSASCALADFSLVNERECKISPEQMFRQPGSSGEKAPSFPAAPFLRSRRSLARSRLPGLPARPDDLIPGMFAITLRVTQPFFKKIKKYKLLLCEIKVTISGASGNWRRKMEQQQLHNFKVFFNNDISSSSPPQSFKHQIKTMGSMAVFQRNNLPKVPHEIPSRQETPYTALFFRSNGNSGRLVFLQAQISSLLNGVCRLCYNV